MKKNSTPLLLLSAAMLISCGGNNPSSNPSKDSADSEPSVPSVPSSEPSNPSSDPIAPSVPSALTGDFAEAVTRILEDHNYTLHAKTEVEYDSDSPYDDYYYNINDKAYYSAYYNSYTGIIAQGNQGYVSYLQSGTTIKPLEFYSTNAEVGVSTLYELVAENLFLGDYELEDAATGVYSTTDTNSIAVGCNFTGFMETANLVAPEKLYASYDSAKDAVVVEVNFTNWYLDSKTGAETAQHGKTTLSIESIGTTRNATVEAYVENPTTTYEAHTDWTADQKAIFAASYNGVVPAFIPNSSYALDVYDDLDYKGTFIRATDLACGNQSEAYAKLLVDDGYSKTSDTKYTKVVKDSANSKTTTYSVEMAYVDPSTEKGLRTIGHYFPNGVFQVEYRAKTVSVSIGSVEELNGYITANNLDRYVPLLPFGSTCVKISNFEDRTASMNQNYQTDEYVFYTNTTYATATFNTSSDAKAAAQSYVDLLKKYGYTEESNFMGMLTLSQPEEEGVSSPSYVAITAPSSITGTTFQFRFNLTKGVKAYDPSEETAVLASISVADMTTEYQINDEFVFDGIVTAYYSDGSSETVEATSVSSPDMSTSGEKDVTVSYSEGGITKTFTYIITVTGEVPPEEEEGITVNVATGLIGGSIRIISGASDEIAEGDRIVFSVSVEDGYELKNVFIVEDPSIEITKNPMGNSYFFFVPNHSVTISATFARIGGEEESSAPSSSSETPVVTKEPLTSREYWRLDCTDGNTTMYTQEISFKEDGTGSMTTYYDGGDGTGEVTYSFNWAKGSAEGKTYSLELSEIAEASKDGKTISSYHLGKLTAITATYSDDDSSIVSISVSLSNRYGNVTKTFAYNA